MPSVRASAAARSIWPASAAVQLLVERLVRPRQTDGVVGEKHQPLQMDFLDAGLGRDPDEVRQLLDGFAQTGEPGRDPRLEVALALLQLAEGADVFQDAIEVVLAANGEIGFRIRRVEGYAQLVEPRGDQRAAVFLIEHRAVGIEQNIGAAILQVPHHARQMLDQHRLADAMQHGALQLRNLIDDRGEQFPAHVGGRLELLIGARASRAQEIAAVGRLQIKADRLVLGDFAVRRHAFEIALGIDRPFCRRPLHGLSLVEE